MRSMKTLLSSRRKWTGSRRLVIVGCLTMFIIFYFARSTWDSRSILQQEPKFQQDPLAFERPVENGTVTIPKVEDRPEAQSGIIEEILKWDPPDLPNHYPPYDGYKGKDYDPNRWEGFPMDDGFYAGGINDLEQSSRSKKAQIPTPYIPYPDYNSPEWRKDWRGLWRACVGPRGLNLDQSPDDIVYYMPGTPLSFPRPTLGSFEELGLDNSVCFDRYSRYGAYGFGEEDTDVPQWRKPTKVKWKEVRWGQLQDRCMQYNAGRYPTPEMDPAVYLKKSPSYKPRSAVLIRTWDSYQYQENDMHTIRALITELSLRSGGEYQVFLFVQVKDVRIQIFEDPTLYQEVLQKSVPEEFWELAILWNEQLCEKQYPKVGENSVYWQQFQPIQWFSKKHPGFEYIWNWEMDARYTGHHYHLLDKISSWAKKQPRKYLWERSSRFWIPSFHGSWEAFSILVAKLTRKSVWGPVLVKNSSKIYGVDPPSTMEADNYTWGVGDDADLITLLPFFNPEGTGWAPAEKIWNYPQGPKTPRRAFINTLIRMSKTLLKAMDHENNVSHSMASEMWPATVALHHGLKAVHVPQPIYLDRKWPAIYVDHVFNAGPPDNPSGGNDSVYNPDREHNFGGFSWYFWANFPQILYRRWLGIATHDENGNWAGGREWELHRGRMCLPGMLLHPVKNVTRDVEM